MENIELYKKRIKEGGVIRNKINNIYFKRMKLLTDIFKYYFGREGREFKIIKDMIHYRNGGYPSPTTPPKAVTLANKLADAYIGLSYIGEEKQLVDALKERGLKIVAIKDIKEMMEKEIDVSDSERMEKVKENWYKYYTKGKIKLPSKPINILKTIVHSGDLLQGKICEQANIIRLEMGEEIEENCKINKKDFKKAVAIQSKKIDNKDIKKNVEKRVSESNVIKESISIFQK